MLPSPTSVLDYYWVLMNVFVVCKFDESSAGVDSLVFAGLLLSVFVLIALLTKYLPNDRSWMGPWDVRHFLLACPG